MSCRRRSVAPRNGINESGDPRAKQRAEIVCRQAAVLHDIYEEALIGETARWLKDHATPQVATAVRLLNEALERTS